MRESQNRNDQPTRPRRKPWVLKVIAIGVVLTVVTTILIHQRDIVPDVHIPTAVVPKPNAYDYFMVAADMVDKHLTSHRPKRPTTYLPTTWLAYPLDQQEIMVAGSEPILEKLHEGFKYPLLNPTALTHEDSLDNESKFRGLVSFLPCVEIIKAAHGDWAGSVDAYLDTAQASQMFPRGGNGGDMSAALYGSAVRRFTDHPVVWDSLDHLSAPQARAAALRLRGISAMHVPYADIALEEKWDGLDYMLKQCHQGDWRFELAKSIGAPGGTAVAAAVWVWLNVSFVSNRTIIANWTKYNDQLIANARRPYAAPAKLPATPTDPVNALKFQNAPSVYYLGRGPIQFKDTLQQSQFAILTTCFALRAYLVEHGTYPADLAALVPGYLPSLPDDPFALSGPLRYWRTGKTYLLYSVGPDGKDDGGKPVISSVTGGAARKYQVKQDSLGDVVAGINKW